MPCLAAQIQHGNAILGPAGHMMARSPPPQRTASSSRAHGVNEAGPPADELADYRVDRLM